MAGPDGIDSTALKRFPLFSAIRLLTLQAEEGRLPLGRFHAPGREAVRLTGSIRLSHPPNEIESVEFPGGDAPVLRTCGFGLLGGSGELPMAWSAHALEREQRGDTGFAAFFDVFHHRMLSFLYRAWCSARFPLAAEASEPNPMDGFLWSLLGLTDSAVPDEIVPALLSSAALLMPRSRPAEALRCLLENYFDVPVEIEQFRGGWRQFDERQYTRLDDAPPDPRPEWQLGRGAAAGGEAWDPQAAVRIRLGPMPRDRYEEFLPGGPAYVAVRQLTDFFAHGSFDYELNPVLRREDVPRVRLGESPEPRSPQYQAAEVRLGWTTWLTSRPLDRDADETVLRSWQAPATESDDESARIGDQARPGRPQGARGSRGDVREPDAL